MPYDKLSVFVHLSYVKGISWVQLYCKLECYLFNIQAYDTITPVLFLTTLNLYLSEWIWLSMALIKLLKHFISLL